MQSTTKKLRMMSIIVLMPLLTFSTSIIYPKLGTPIVAPDRIIFSELEHDSHRIRCISRTTGEELWEIKDADATLEPCFITGDKLIFTKDADIYAADLITGQNDVLYRTGYDRCSLEKCAEDRVLVEGELDNVDYLSLVDLETGKAYWRIPNIAYVLTEDNGVALCKYGEREYEDEGYTHVNEKLVAISISTGQELWTSSRLDGGWLADAVSVKGTFVIEELNRIHCVDQQSGSIISSFIMTDEPGYHPVSLVRYEDKVIVWTRQGDDLYSGYVIYSLSVPGLKEITFFEPEHDSATTFVYDDVIVGRTIGRTEAYDLNTGEKLWSGGQWSWSGEFDGFLYFSRSVHDGKHTVLEKINIRTGERTEVYKALLPEEYQWEAEEKPESMKNAGFNYALIPQLVSSNEIERVEIYCPGIDTFDAVLIKRDGSRVPVEKPFYLTEDAVFLHQLTAHDIAYVLDDENEAEKTFKKKVDILHYQSIPGLLTSIEIEKVEVYGREADEIEAVFVKADGHRIPVSGCYGLDEDPVFHQYLRENDIPYIVYDKELKIDATDEEAPAAKSNKMTTRVFLRFMAVDLLEFSLRMFLLILAASSPLWSSVLLALLFRKIRRSILTAAVTMTWAIILLILMNSLAYPDWHHWKWSAASVVIRWSQLIIINVIIVFPFVIGGIVIGDQILKRKKLANAQ